MQGLLNVWPRPYSQEKLKTKVILFLWEGGEQRVSFQGCSHGNENKQKETYVIILARRSSLIRAMSCELVTLLYWLWMISDLTVNSCPFSSVLKPPTALYAPNLKYWVVLFLWNYYFILVLGHATGKKFLQHQQFVEMTLRWCVRLRNNRELKQ